MGPCGTQPESVGRGLVGPRVSLDLPRSGTGKVTRTSGGVEPRIGACIRSETLSLFAERLSKG
jgi:hypothetical protein